LTSGTWLHLAVVPIFGSNTNSHIICIKQNRIQIKQKIALKFYKKKYTLPEWKNVCWLSGTLGKIITTVSSDLVRDAIHQTLH